MLRDRIRRRSRPTPQRPKGAAAGPRRPEARRIAPRRAVSIAQLGARIREARARRGLSLEQVAGRSGVSRAMLSAVERGRKVPSILIVDRIATALDTSIARLLGEEERHRVILKRRGEQSVARDPAGWERRILSPVLPGVEFELMRTTIAPGVDAGSFDPHAPGSREYVAVEQGTLRLTINGEAVLLEAGDSIYYDGDCHHGFANPGRRPCIYYLAMEVAGGHGAGEPDGRARRGAR